MSFSHVVFNAHVGRKKAGKYKESSHPCKMRFKPSSLKRINVMGNYPSIPNRTYTIYWHSFS